MEESVHEPLQWFFLRSGPGTPALNMAIDEALLESAPSRYQPVLRFYGWTEPAASFGYFQRYQEVERLTTLRPLVRRPTGGGIVPHDADWTYSLIFPPDHEWYALSARDSYRHVHVWIKSALARLDFDTQLAPVSLKTQPGQCFVGHEQFDLLWKGGKIAGAAQRRRRDGLLIQGSVRPPNSLSITRDSWEQAMLDVSSSVNSVAWEAYPQNSSLAKRAMELVRVKYSQQGYNLRRLNT
jgi:lipoate-protein ligase A